jgi:nucleotide-binding universal stress UspA family protein
MKKILVPCDFSEPSIQAFKFALQLARKSKGTIILLHVIEFPVLHDTMIMPVVSFEMDFFKDLKTSVKKRFDKLITRWVEGEMKIQYAIQLGPVQRTIQEYVRKHTIDLVLMGTHGVGGLREFFVGSTTNKIIGSVKIPVLSIKKSIPLSKVRNIVYPTTLQLNQSSLIDKLKKLQEFFGATLHLLTVNTPANLKRTFDERQLMEDYARRCRFTNYTLNTRNDFTEEAGILNFVVESKADIIAMGAHGRSGLAHLFNANIAESVINHNESMVWTYLIK